MTPRQQKEADNVAISEFAERIKKLIDEAYVAGQRAQAEKDAEIADAEVVIALHKQSAKWIAAAIRAAAPKEGEPVKPKPRKESGDPWGLKDIPLDSWERE